MSLWIVAVIVTFAVLAAGIGLYALRREPPPAPLPVIQTDDQGDLAARRARQAVLEPIEQELLDRRIELDAKRGTLAGDSAVYDAFVELEHRLRSGEIGEDEFEAEKLRLLGGR
jgi:hypothetical protein